MLIILNLYIGVKHIATRGRFLAGTFEAHLIRASGYGYSSNLLGHCISTCGTVGVTRAPVDKACVYTYIYMALYEAIYY